MERKAKILAWLAPVLGVGLFASIVLLRIYVIEVFYIPSGAMIPTLQVGDNILVDKLKRKPGRGDIIVFKFPLEKTKDFVKRAVAVGGDTVEVRDDKLFINDREVPRTRQPGECRYRDYDDARGVWFEGTCTAFTEQLDGKSYTIQQDNTAPRSWPRQTVPPDHYFVMGDNRDHTYDSRFWGFVPAELVKGTFMRVWWHNPKK
jgi:signal peptidase I